MLQRHLSNTRSAMSCLPLAPLTSLTKLTKSQRRRARRKKLEGVELKTNQGQSAEINSITPNVIISSLRLVSGEDQAGENLTYQQKCIDHVHYVYAKNKFTSDTPVELIQEDPEMYFRKKFIVYAIDEPFNEIFTQRPSVTKYECIAHCKSLIENHCDSGDNIQNSTLMIYRKQIIRLAISKYERKYEN